MRFIYPVLLERVSQDEIVVSFRDLPECLTAGSDEAEALAEAQDALAEAIAGRIDDDEDIPSPSEPAVGERLVAVPTEVAAKAALAVACRQSGLSLGTLADLLGMDRQAVSRMLDPRQVTDADCISRALRALGCRVVAVEPQPDCARLLRSCFDDSFRRERGRRTRTHPIRVR